MNRHHPGPALLVAAVGWQSVAAPDAVADVLICHFTEPYITVRHDTTAATVEISRFQRATEHFRDAGLDIIGVNQLQLRWGEDQALRLTIDYRGSDLMSDHIFPISAEYFAISDPQRSLLGGCTTNELAMIVPVDEPE